MNALSSYKLRFQKFQECFDRSSGCIFLRLCANVGLLWASQMSAAFVSLPSHPVPSRVKRALLFPQMSNIRPSNFIWI